MVALKSVNRTTLREQVLAELRSSILNGELSPGTKLAETDVAASLGVSRGTVREALRTLHQSGLLVGEERTSLYVRRLSPTEVNELFQLRIALEGLAVSLIVARADADRIADDLEALLPSDDASETIAARFQRDISFHEALLKAAGNGLLLTSWQGVQDLMWLVVLGSQQPPTELMSKTHHQPIIDGIKTGDPIKAQRAVADHLTTAGRRWAN